MTDLLDNPNTALPPIDAAAPAAASADIAPPSERIGTILGSSLVEAAAGREIGVLVPPPGRIVVLVPHPGDEVLATGGLIAHQRLRGREVTIVAVTDGHVDGHDRNGFRSAAARRRQQLDALERLGVGRQSLHRLEIPDGGVSAHVEDVSAYVTELITPDDVIVAPALVDRDVDHGACGRAAIAVAARVGCDVLGSLSPAGRPPSPRLPTPGLAALALTDDELASRRAALACHRSLLLPLDSSARHPERSHAASTHVLDRPVECYVVGAPSHLRP